MLFSRFGPRALIISAALWLGDADSLHATSVVALSFAELVAEAETIVRARVVTEHDVQLPQGSNPLEARIKSVAAALSPLAFEQRIIAELSRRVALP